MGDVMLKKIFSFLGTATLVCFSFYYTDSAVDLVRKSDPIMKEIESFSEEFGNTSIDSLLIDNSIIPGVKGVSVDIDESYKNMKRLGKFDKSLLVYKEEYPKNRIKNNYDKYIISGNKSKNNVSLIFVITNTSYIEDILNILNSKNVTATFFIDKNIFDKGLDAVKLLYLFGEDIELFSNDYSLDDLKKYDYIKEKYMDEALNFCYVKDENIDILNRCKSMKLYTIKPISISTSFPYNDIKNNLDNGMIITLTNNKETVRELSSIIKYIEQKGEKIVSLKKIIDE